MERWDIEFRGDGGDFESEAEGDSSGGLDGSQIGVEICRFRGGGGMSEVFHSAQDEGCGRGIYSSKIVSDSKDGKNKFQLVDNGIFSFGRRRGEAGSGALTCAATARPCGVWRGGSS